MCVNRTDGRRRRLGFSVYHQSWYREVEHVAHLCNWVPVFDGSVQECDAYVIEFPYPLPDASNSEWPVGDIHPLLRGRPSPVALATEAREASVPHVLISRGRYEAEVFAEEYVGAAGDLCTWLPAVYPAAYIGTQPILGAWRLNALYEWLAGITPGLNVPSFELVGEPTSGPAVAYLSLRPGLLDALQFEPAALFQLSPEAFEVLILDRFESMGFAVQRIGRSRTPDGGVDLIAAPRSGPLPFLLAIQVKHHASNAPTGPSAVRELEGVASRAPFNIGVLVTNTSFTADAKWIAGERPHLIRLRDVRDVVRWLYEDFLSDDWSQFPKELELRPGLRVRLPTLDGHPRHAGDTDNRHVGP